MILYLWLVFNWYLNYLLFEEMEFSANILYQLNAKALH